MQSSRKLLTIRSNMRSLFCFLLLALSATAVAQELDSPSLGLFIGSGIQHNGGNSAALHAGASIDQTLPNGWIGWMFEGGYAGPFNNLKGGSALFSFDYMPSWALQKKSSKFPLFCPFAAAGYTQLFGTGPAVNFGAGMDFRFSGKFALRLEARDYMGFTPHEHIAALRIGFRRYLWD